MISILSRALSLLAVTCVLSGGTRIWAQHAGDPPSISQLTAYPSADQRRGLARLIEQNASAAKLWKAAQLRAEEALAAPPDPIDEIFYEGRLNHDPKRLQSIENLRDMDRLAALTEAWAVTDDARYASKMEELISAWTNTYRPTGNPINENKLEPLLTAYASRRGDMPVDARAPIDRWIRAMAEHGIEHGKRHESTTQNNWHPKRLKIVALAGHILEDQALIQYARDEAQRYVELHLRPDGSSHDFEQRDALSYHIGGIKPLLRLAAILAPADVDLFNYQAQSGASLRKSVDFIVPYARGEKTHGEFARSKVGLDRRRAEAGIEHYRPGRPFDPQQSRQLFELAVHFDDGYRLVLDALGAGRGDAFTSWTAVLGSVGWIQEEIGK